MATGGGSTIAGHEYDTARGEANEKNSSALFN